MVTKKIAASTKPKKTTAPKQKAAPRATFGASWLERFHAMVAELRTDPEIRIHQLQVNPPASEADLAAVEKHLGARLAPALRTFYQAADGLMLRWIHARHPDIGSPKAGVVARKLKTGTILAGDTIEHGLINLRPVRETFLDADWEGGIWFDHLSDCDPVEIDGGEVPSLTFHQALRPFDVYNFYEINALYCRPGNGDPPVLFGTDHGVDWSDSCEEKKHPTFESYLETILAHRGLIESRAKIRPREHWEKHPVSLKKLLAGLELTPKVSTGGADLLARLKKKNKDAILSVDDAEVARLGLDREAVITVLRKQLAPDTWQVIRALQRLRAFTDGDVPLLAAVAKKGGAAAVDALGDLAATSDRALKALVGLLAKRQHARGQTSVAALALAALPRAGERCAFGVPAVKGVLEEWLSEPRKLFDADDFDLGPWLLFLALAGPHGLPAVPEVARIQKLASAWRAEPEGPYSTWPSYRRVVDRFAVAAILAAREAPAEVRIEYVKQYLQYTSTYGSTTMFEEVAILCAHWPHLGSRAAEALPVVEGFLDYLRGLAGSSSMRAHHAEAAALSRRLAGLVAGLPQGAVAAG